jgi:hypothetical protein
MVTGSCLLGNEVPLSRIRSSGKNRAPVSTEASATASGVTCAGGDDDGGVAMPEDCRNGIDDEWIRFGTKFGTSKIQT